MYMALYMKTVDILKLGSARSGSRGYIAFSGYLKIPVVMGSRCTSLKSKIGGFKGRKLMEGDYISFRIKRNYLPFFLSRKLELHEYDEESGTLRVVMGPQDGGVRRGSTATVSGRGKQLHRDARADP